MREVRWDGLLPDGRLAPPGRYELGVVGRSQLLARSDSMRVYFTVAHETAPLEDTLPDLAPAQLLPERLLVAAGRKDLIKGLAVAAGALLGSSVAVNRDLGRGGRALAIAVGATAGIAGVTALLNARHERDLPANIAENVRRRAARAAADASIAQRNAEKIAETGLIIKPAGRVGPARH